MAAAVQSNLNTHITDYGTLTGLTNTVTARTNLNVYSKDEAAQKNGDASQLFSVANGTTNNEAVNKSQLDAKADKNGSSSETFSVATATSADHAVRKDQFDAKTGTATVTTAGIVEKATQAEMNAGTANVWPDAATLLNGFSQSSSSIRLPEWLGGWLIQWGYTQVGDVGIGNDEPTTVFAVPYSYPPHVMVSGWSDAGQAQFAANVRSVSSSSFVAILSEWNNVVQGPNTGFNWFAIGK